MSGCYVIIISLHYFKINETVALLNISLLTSYILQKIGNLNMNMFTVESC